MSARKAGPRGIVLVALGCRCIGDRGRASVCACTMVGAYELLFTETAARAVIDEAVELDKRFGGAQSAQFVNGILDHLMHQSKPAGATGAVGGLSPEA